jgi:hypothetical protein
VDAASYILPAALWTVPADPPQGEACPAPCCMGAHPPNTTVAATTEKRSNKFINWAPKY